MTARHLIEVKDLTFGYRGRPPLFDGAALAIHEDDQIGLWADNGTGKTTLLRILTGLVRPQSMTLTLDGRVISDEEGFRAVRRHFGFVLQNPDDQLFFPEVLDDVMFGPLNLGLSYEEARERSEAALGELGIAELAHAESFRLSGGQKRLVSLACVLSMAPDGLLLDEPTAGLDRGARERLIRVLQGLRGPRLCVSHSMAFLQAVSSRLVTIRDGHIAALDFDGAGHFG